MTRKNSILVIAAHPDDEVLGCGATIAKHVAKGDIVNVAIMAEGLTSRDNSRNRKMREGELSELAQTAHKANKSLGVSELTLFNHPDNRMDGVELLNIVKDIEGLIKKFNPNIIYTHYYDDLNIDHAITSRAVTTACRPLPGQKIDSILFFEVQSSTEWQMPNSFSPNWFEDVSESFNKKIKALEIYASEMRPWPHARSIPAVESLGKLRGSTIGCNFAEAFMLGRKIN